MLWHYARKDVVAVAPEAEKPAAVAVAMPPPSGHFGTKPKMTSASRAAVLTLAAFKEKFGQELGVETNRKGQLLRVRGSLSISTRFRGEYKSDDPAHVLARAREVLESAAGLIGIRQDSPCGEPEVTAGAGSAQVVFKQYYDGKPLEPLGKITIDIGPRGELVALYSTYATGFEMVNNDVIDRAVAFEAARRAQPSMHAALASGGRKVIWVAQAEKMEGRYSYEFHVEGRRIIIDAGNGKVIFTRDMRKF